MEEKQEEKQIPHAQKILNRLQDNKDAIFIKRVPEKTILKFKKLANEEFCGDYGFTLKWLIDDLIDGDIKAVILRQQALEIEVHELKEKVASMRVPEEKSESTKKERIQKMLASQAKKK